MNPTAYTLGGSLKLLQLSAWIRRHRLLRSLCHIVPARLRRSFFGTLIAQASESMRFPRTPAWHRPLQREQAPTPPMIAAGPTVGVNIVGYIRGEFGLAEAARLYIRALIGAGIDVRLFDLDLGLPHGREDRSLEPWIDETLPHSTTIVFVNPDFLGEALERVGHEKLDGRHLIACWFWELEKVPSEWLLSLQMVDEIMVATRFIEDAFRHVTKKPVLRVPLPLSSVPDSGLQRADFGLKDDVFLFLTSFDFHSGIERKNPFAAIDAFERAFPRDCEHVRLLIKTSNGCRYSEKLEVLLERAACDPRILIRDDIIDRSHFNALQRCCDAYVSLHRAEGFGLGLAECMAMGKPVIATAWSGNLEFMDNETACLVDYRLVEVGNGEYLHSEGAVWAEASIDSASAAMQRLVDDSAWASALGERARQSVLQKLAPPLAAARLQARLAELNLLKERQPDA